MPAAPIDPLTGQPSELESGRPALVVKIDNHDRARPQHGINSADVVYEEIVEGGLTRLAAVFHSRDAGVVGPVRSVRTSDFPVLANLGVPLFANSGGNANVLAGLSAVDMVDVSSNAEAGAYYRDDDRPAPHNLLSDTASLWAAGIERGAAGSPPALFVYAEGADASGEGTTGIAIDYGTTQVEYRWDGQGWVRWQNGREHVDADGVIVAPENVVVQFVAYGRTDDGRSPEAELLGQGALWVLTDGRLITGTWSRAADGDVSRLVDEAGAPILLQPGTTWIALPRVGQVTVLD